MDWSKAKTILIVAFLILNIFLGFSLWNMYKQTGLLPDSDEVNREINRLLQEQYSITMPRDIPKMKQVGKALNVTYAPQSKEEVLRGLFPERSGEWTEENIYQWNDEILYFGDQFYYYTSEGTEELRRLPEASKILRLAEESINSDASRIKLEGTLRKSLKEAIGVDLEEWEILEVIMSGEEGRICWDIAFIQVWDYPVRDYFSRTRLRIDENGGLMAFYRSALMTISEGDSLWERLRDKVLSRKEAMSVTEAIMALVTAGEIPAGCQITEVVPVYLGIGAEDYFLAEEKPHQWTIRLIYNIKALLGTGERREYFLDPETGWLLDSIERRNN